MKRFVLRFVIFATLFVLILPAGSLAAATGTVNPEIADSEGIPAW